MVSEVRVKAVASPLWRRTDKQTMPDDLLAEIEISGYACDARALRWDTESYNHLMGMNMLNVSCIANTVRCSILTVRVRPDSDTSAALWCMWKHPRPTMLGGISASAQSSMESRVAPASRVPPGAMLPPTHIPDGQAYAFAKIQLALVSSVLTTPN